MTDYHSRAVGAGDTKIHPCARGFSSSKDAEGWATYTIRYQHIMTEGKCKVCGETLEEMLADGATISKSEDQSKANNEKKGNYIDYPRKGTKEIKMPSMSHENVLRSEEAGNKTICYACGKQLEENKPYASMGGNIEPYIPANLYHIRCIPTVKPVDDTEQKG